MLLRIHSYEAQETLLGLPSLPQQIASGKRWIGHVGFQLPILVFSMKINATRGVWHRPIPHSQCRTYGHSVLGVVRSSANVYGQFYTNIRAHFCAFTMVASSDLTADLMAQTNSIIDPSDSVSSGHNICVGSGTNRTYG